MISNTHTALARTNNYAVLFNTIEHAIILIHSLASARTALYRTIHLRGYIIPNPCIAMHSLYTRVALARTNLLRLTA